MYTDDMKKVPGKGEFSDEYGLYVLRPFHIQSQMTNKRYLDVIAGDNKVKIKTPNGFDSQVWTFDYTSRTIKNVKDKSKSLDIRNTKMYLYPTNSEWYQIFKYEDGFFRNLKNNKVFDVSGGKDAEAQDVQAYNKHGGANQKFKVIYLDKKGKEQTKGYNEKWGMHINRPFYIVSKMHLNRVVSVAGGYNLVIQSRKDKPDNRQLFFFDMRTKTIKSYQFKDRSVDMRGGSVYVYKTSARWYQLIRYNGAQFVNEQGTIMEAQSGHDSENRQVTRVGMKNNFLGNQWTILYADKAKPTQTSGFSKEWGMYINRPFHIVSEMKSHRYLDLLNNGAVIKTPNGKDSQVWFFDYKTRTIKSQRTKTSSLDGRSNQLNVYATNTNGQWYQLFKYSGQMIINVKDNRAIDVSATADKEGQKVHTWTQHNKANQRWKIVYLDKKEREPTKGLNEEWGMYINRPFYIQSRMFMNRVVSVAGGWNLVIQNRVNGDKRQLWFFDQTTKTIKSFHDKKRSMDFRGGNIYAYATDSRWY